MKFSLFLPILCVVIATVMTNSQINENRMDEETIKFYWYSRVSEEAIRSQ